MLSMMYQQVKVDRIVWETWDLVLGKTKLWIDLGTDPVIRLIGLVIDQ